MMAQKDMDTFLTEIGQHIPALRGDRRYGQHTTGLGDSRGRSEGVLSPADETLCEANKLVCKFRGLARLSWQAPLSK